jgi:hypothetical protein
VLLERDGGRKSFDRVHLRYAGLLDQTARVWRDRFEVAALGLGIQGAEGQRGFSGAGYSREYHQRVARKVQIDALQIVLAGTANADESIDGKAWLHGFNPTQLSLKR